MFVVRASRQWYVPEPFIMQDGCTHSCTAIFVPANAPDRLYVLQKPAPRSCSHCFQIVRSWQLRTHRSCYHETKHLACWFEAKGWKAVGPTGN